MQHLKAAGSRHSVVMSQNNIPFFGKSGTPRMAFATSSFLSFSNIVPSDSTTARLGLLTGERFCDKDLLSPVLKLCLLQGKGDGSLLRTNMRIYTLQPFTPCFSALEPLDRYT